MTNKRGFNVYYLLVSEGTTEFNLFAYLTKNKFRLLFDLSNVKFSPKIEITEAGISQGKLAGVSDIKGFKAKYALIRKYYKGQKKFFLLDKDLDDSSKIESLIRQNHDIVQFLDCNSEHLLLKLAGKNPRKPSSFKSMSEFRNYCKSEFVLQFRKVASDFKDTDFDSIFSKVSDEKIKRIFAELFSVLS